MANLAMQPGNVVRAVVVAVGAIVAEIRARVVAISARALARTAAPVWPARASHAFKRSAVVRFTGMFRL